MNNSTVLKLAIVAGMAIFGAILMSIETASGYLAWHASYRASFSPWFTGGMALIGGGLCGWRIAIACSLGKAATIAVVVPCALVLGTIAWASQAYGLYNVIAHLSVGSAALVGAVFMGTVGAIGVTVAKI